MTAIQNRLLLAGLAVCVGLALAGPVSAEPWPYEPFNETHLLGNHYGTYQNYGGSPYYHDGIDINNPEGPRATYSVSYGVVTHLTQNQPLYSGIMIGEPFSGGVGWLYWHINSTTWQYDVGDVVDESAYIGHTANWPVASFHHVHFNRVRGTGGYPWTWYDAIDNPLLYMEPNDDPDPPELMETYNGNVFAFVDNSSHAVEDHLALSGQVDIVSRIQDFVGMPEWPLNPWRIDYWVEGADQSVPRTNTVTFSGDCPADGTIPVIYRTQYPMKTYGDYDSRIYYFYITNTDGDGFVESGDASYNWDTSLFDAGDYWVFVEAEDIGGTAVRDSMWCVVAGLIDPDIGVRPSAYDFGQVGEMTTWSFTVSNTGTTALSVREITSTSSAFTVDRSRFFVGPGEGVDVVVTFDPTEYGLYIADLQIQSNDPDEPVVVVHLQAEYVDLEAAGDRTSPVTFGIRSTRTLPGEGVAIAYSIAKSGPVSIEVYDIAGRRLQLHNLGTQPAGSHDWNWDKAGWPSGLITSGLYLFRLHSGGQTDRASAVLVR